MLWEKRHGNSEPHITGQEVIIANSCRLACSSQSMALLVQPSGESWFPQLSIFPLQPGTANHSCIYFAWLICIVTHMTSNQLGKKPYSLHLHSHLFRWDCFGRSWCFCWWFRHKQMQKISYSSSKKRWSKVSLSLTTLLSCWWEVPFHVWQRSKGAGIMADDWKHM